MIACKVQEGLWPDLKNRRIETKEFGTVAAIGRKHHV